jgi:hypothetical protein
MTQHNCGDPEGAALARRRAAHAVLEEKVRRQEVRRVAARLRDLQEKNHFGELIARCVEDNSRTA